MFTEISADVLCLLGLEDNFVISVEGKHHFGENEIGFLEFLLEIQYIDVLGENIHLCS